MSSSQWLGSSNSYATDLTKLKADIKAGRAPHQRDLSQYIAASCLLHCADGWGYLGRSISALLRGDPHIARHLAYYAELRATKSLLAARGVGIFNHHHFAITAANQAKQLDNKSGTHDFSWACLDYWSSLSTSGDLFIKLIRPFGLDLAQWFDPVGGANVVAKQAQAWFRQWGMDLKSFPDDRDARNLSSYQPDGLPKAWELEAAEVLNYVSELWSVLEPSANSRFDIIDRHILRVSIETHFQALSGRAASQAAPDFLRHVTKIVKPQNFDPPVEAEIVRFLTRKVMPADSLVLIRSREPNTISGSGAETIASRATLLLRTASGAAADLFRSVGITEAELEFWSSGLGRARGLWEGSAVAPTDLWADIDLQLGEVADFQSKHAKNKQTFYRIGAELHEALIDLGSCERAAIWGAIP
ncbi:hypothetical protein Bra471DRAFT_00623 [Bradyrhizobium sp. WSM471]|nr:hypothetical protein Bra471DRAFT_00623 [Bradyrhizobium sp. WSM471]